MDNNDILKRIREIVFTVPDGVYKFIPPEDCFEGELEELSQKEKVFVLIEDLLIAANIEKIEEKRKDKPEVAMEIIIDME
ncbi:hypothetical protein [Clostridium sp. 'White wine YQ']|uniref:hypothetical protein n=1 Tax=Clostridium sp. 'White wine YQ' TaxID=3027474 RepID=UPI002366C5DF|nr:hypothetical protein [Clostridium sp. 'White wine YQ']MDD7795878.1 hypothetical protein [Clostridium sp. 'White wine YQ']